MYLDQLNERQLYAVTRPLGHVLVLAGAGSGKTRVLVSRVAWLVKEQNLALSNILAVTFTNKAALEMKGRLRDLLQVSVHDMWVGTFHGLCHRLLRRHYREANLPDNFHIMDHDDQGRLIKRIMLNMSIDTERWPVKQAQAFINDKKDQGLRARYVEAPSYGPSKTWLAVYHAYEQACQAAGVVDFSELLLRTLELLRQHPEVLAHYHARFKAILVDEFQDTNPIQYAWIQLLTNNTASVMAVGDDDQSIYGWRGAKIENVTHFTRDFIPGEVIRLEQNYRSTKVILDAANTLIANNNTRMGKTLWTEGASGEKITLYRAFNELDEARFVVDRVENLLRRGIAARDIAILYRSNAQSRVLEDALFYAGVVYRIHGGLRFFDRAEIKDALAYLRLLYNQNDDIAFERVVNFPARGIGEKTLQDIRSCAKETGNSLWEITQAMLSDGVLSSRATTALRKFITLITRLQADLATLPLGEQVTQVLHHSGLRDYYAQLKSENAESKVENLQELINAATQFEMEHVSEDTTTPLLVTFLSHAALEAGEIANKAEDDYMHLMTLHASKGLEFPYVFLVGMEEGVFPSVQSIDDPKRLEEERRLCYVGMTRAMEVLSLSYAEIRRQYGREEYHRPSRFLKEIPKQLLVEQH